MELYQLRTFSTVAETGNLTHAAERLFTSQPAISAHVKALEEELGVKLFTRTPKGMVLTEDGNVLREKANLVLQASNELQLEAKYLQGELTGQVKLGLNTDADFLKLSSLHAALVTNYPQLKIQITQGITAELLLEVKRGSLDGTFYFGWDEPEGISFLELLETEIVVAGHHKWAKEIEFADTKQLAELPWIHPVPFCPYSKFVKKIFPQGGPQPDWITDAASENSMNALLRAGAGVAFIRVDEARPWINEGSIYAWPGKTFTLPLKFAYLESRKNDPLVKALVENVDDIFRNQ